MVGAGAAGGSRLPAFTGADESAANASTIEPPTTKERPVVLMHSSCKNAQIVAGTDLGVKLPLHERDSRRCRATSSPGSIGACGPRGAARAKRGPAKVGECAKA